jgi:hypothetical protein
MVGQDDRQLPEKQSCFNGCYMLMSRLGLSLRTPQHIMEAKRSDR